MPLYKTTPNQTSFLIFSLAILPFIISIIVLYETSPFYGHGCTGCILYNSEEYLFLAQAVIVCVVSSILFYFLRKAEDPLFILWEIRWTALFAGIGALLGFVIGWIILYSCQTIYIEREKRINSAMFYLLDLFNPGHLASSGVVTWGWFILFGTLAAFAMCAYWPVFHIYRSSLAASPTEQSGLTLDRVLQDSVLKSRFAVHLMHEFAIEVRTPLFCAMLASDHMF